MTDVQGTTAPGFEGVADAFAANFTEHGELGASFAAYRDGELVADLWGGLADRATERPWSADTLQLIFSGAKGLTAACFLLLAERGLDLDAPVARYWPEFAAAGKGAITVRQVLTHQAGLPGVAEPHTYADWLDHETMAGLLAAQAPSADPRAGFMYHAVTFGWLTAELVARVDGRSIGAFFAEEFAVPLGLDAWIGVPDEHHARVSTMVAAPDVLADVDVENEPDALKVLTRNILVGSEGPGIWNAPNFRRTQNAAIGVHATARAMARFYACLVRGGEIDGVRVLKESTVEAGRREIRRGTEPMWGGPMAYATGFELQTETLRFGAPADAYGHAGWGGSRHAAWPGPKVGYSYCMNEIRTAMPDRRPLDLLDALHKAVTSGG